MPLPSLRVTPGAFDDAGLGSAAARPSVGVAVDLLGRPGSRHRIPTPGDRRELVPPHCDPTVDRYDLLHVVRDDVLVDVVPIVARGCSQ